MLKPIWRRTSSPATWVLTLVLGAPALVQAQTQLFPLAPIQRQRVPCPMEDPVYGRHRHEYFGYFPTCWRTFPPGWGCPSPEAPNQALEFQRRPRDKPPESLPEVDERGPVPMPEERPRIPTEPRSPFEIDNAPTPPGRAMPRDDRSIPPGSSRIDPRRAAPGATEETNEAAAPLLALPDPAEAPTTATPPGPVQGLDPQPNPGNPIETQGIPDGTNPPQLEHGRPVMNPAPAPYPLPSPTSPANALAPTAGAPVARPVQAPQRRGPLSTFFSGLTSRLRR